MIFILSIGVAQRRRLRRGRALAHAHNPGLGERRRRVASRPCHGRTRQSRLNGGLARLTDTFSRNSRALVSTSKV